MKKHDLWSGLFWLISGIGLCIGSINANLGNLRTPGTGFFPFIIGILLTLFGSILVISTISKRRGKDENVISEKRFINWNKLLFPSITLLILLGYVLFLEDLGFLLTTFLCLLALFKLSEPRNWLMPLVFSAGVVILSYLIFVLWLRNPFPRGIFGF
jgi:putative tricarboxylic transport membrane protein